MDACGLIFCFALCGGVKWFVTYCVCVCMICLNSLWTFNNITLKVSEHIIWDTDGNKSVVNNTINLSVKFVAFVHVFRFYFNSLYLIYYNQICYLRDIRVMMNLFDAKKFTFKLLVQNQHYGTITLSPYLLNYSINSIKLWIMDLS